MNFDLNFWVKPDLNTNNWIKKCGYRPGFFLHREFLAKGCVKFNSEKKLGCAFPECPGFGQNFLLTKIQKIPQKCDQSMT